MSKEVIITGMKIEKNRLIITEVKQVDSNGMPTRKVNLNEHFAVALKGTIIDLDMDHLKSDYGV